MNLCDRKHAEICYEGHTCPACELKQEADEAKEEIAKLEKQVEQLQQEIDNHE